MSKGNLPQLGQEILSRLSGIDITSCVVNKAIVATALEKYLTALGLAPRPIRWAKDAQQAQDLSAQSELTSVMAARELAMTRIFGDGAERTENVWWTPRREAREAGHQRLLEIVYELIRGYDVLFSVPWVKYWGRRTGDRGLRISPQCVAPWNGVEDALDYASRAAGECAWAQDGNEHHLDFWLPFVDAYEAGLWYFWITEAEVIALSRPTLRLNEGRLHAESGPAISWPGREQEFFFLNGVRVPREPAEPASDKLNAQRVIDLPG